MSLPEQPRDEQPDGEQPQEHPHEHAHEHAVLEELETTEDVRQEALILERAIGGWRGIIDSGVPTVVFVTAYIITGQDLVPALVAAIVAGLIIVVWRVIRHEPLQQVLAGFAGVLVSAAFAKYTGKAENYFLPGFLQNLGYGLAFLISIIVRWPLLGIAMGYLTGDGTKWRQDPQLRRVYAAASWIWVGLFFGRLAVQLPLYFAGAIGALGVVKIVMGVPLYIAAAYFTYRLLAPIYRERREATAKGATPQA